MSGSPSHVRLAPPIHGPEPRLGSKRVTQSVLLLEQTAQNASEEVPRHGRHLKSASAHYYNLDGPTMRKATYVRTRSVDPQSRIPAGTGGSAAALKAAQLSANAHTSQDPRTSSNRSPARTTRIAPYLAAASKAWSNSAAKNPHDLKTVPKIEINSRKLTPPGPEDVVRKSKETLRPSHSEILLPMRSGGRSKSRNSDIVVQEANQHTVNSESHQGPLQAARISFAHDREAHASEYKPPSRPGSTNPQGHALPSAERLNKVATGAQTHDRISPPPGRKSIDSSRAALSAASSIWANHEHDNPRASTPAAEPYTYMTHKPHATLRKTHKEEIGKFWKHGKVQPIPSGDRKRYDGLWAGNKGLLFEGFPQYKEDVANLIVRDIWSRSRLQPEILSDIYDLVDREEKGRLTRDEFVVGTWLVDHSLRGRRLPFKRDLTDDIFDGGYMWRLGITAPKKFKHDEKKYLGAEKRKKH